MAVVLKWTNKFSNETGYVKSVSGVKGCFINTWDKPDAKKYTTSKRLDNDLHILEVVGETQNNVFTTEEA